METNEIDPSAENAVKRFLSRIADRYDMAGALVYGSRARDTHQPDSDADLAVCSLHSRRSNPAAAADQSVSRRRPSIWQGAHC
jgi:predicted nucleotidyltransferase